MEEIKLYNFVETMLNRLKRKLYGMDAHYVISRGEPHFYKKEKVSFNIEVNLTGEPNLPVVSNSLITETILDFLRKYLSFTFSDKNIIEFHYQFEINYDGKFIDKSKAIMSKEFKEFIKNFLSQHKNDAVCLKNFQEDGYGYTKLCVKISDLRYDFYNDTEDMNYLLEGTTEHFVITHPITGGDLVLTDDIWKRFEEETGEDIERVKEALVIVFNTKSVDHTVDLVNEFLEFTGYWGRIPVLIADNIGWRCEFFTSSLKEPNTYPYDYTGADLDHARSAVRIIRDMVANS